MNTKQNEDAFQVYVLATFSLTIEALLKQTGQTLKEAIRAGLELSEAMTAEELASVTTHCLDTHLKVGEMIPEDFDYRTFQPQPQPANRAQRRAAKFKRRNRK